MENYTQQDLLNDEVLQVKYGTFWPRFWAILIDGLVLAILAPPTIYNKTEWKSMPLFIVITIIQVAYKPFFEYKYGATPGKMALNLKVVNYQYMKASLKEILLRNIFQLSGGVVNLGIGIYAFMQPGFSQISTIQEYDALGDVKMITLFVTCGLFVLYIADLIVMLNSEDSRSLHDRIGKTFVIRT